MSFKSCFMLMAGLFLFLSATSVFADLPKVMLMKDLKPGTKAIGFSVFTGVEPEPFDVVLGNKTYQNGEEYILIRIHGQPVSLDTPLEVMAAISGMSGSPIFIECSSYDECLNSGVLVGALSYSIGYFIHGGMNAMATPAEYMLGSKFSGYNAVKKLAADSSPGHYSGGKDLLLRSGPKLTGSGLSMDGLEGFSPAGLVVSSQDCVRLSDKDLKAGSMISIHLAKGDVPYSLSGTVTWRDGNKIYAFGHPMFGSGWVNYPFSQVAVATTLQTPLQASKIPGCSVGNEGAIMLDTTHEVAGMVGRKAPLMPLSFNVLVADQAYSLNEEIATEAPMSPMLLNIIPQIWLKNLMGDVSKLPVGYQSRIVVSGQPELFFQNVLNVGSANESPFQQLCDRITQAAGVLMGSGLRASLERIQVNVKFFREVKVWKTEKVFWQKESLLRTNTRAVPGETLTLSVMLREFPEGEKIRRIDIPVTVPEDFLDGLSPQDQPVVSIILQDGTRFKDISPAHESMASAEDFIKSVNENLNRQSTTVYVQKVYPRRVKTFSDKGNKKSSALPADRTHNQPVSMTWQVLDPADVKAAAPPPNMEVELVKLPALEYPVEIDTKMTISVEKKPAPNAPKQEKKKGKFLWIF